MSLEDDARKAFDEKYPPSHWAGGYSIHKFWFVRGYRSALTLRPMESAPRDGTAIDIFHVEYGRIPNASWMVAAKYWYTRNHIRSALSDDGLTGWLPLPQKEEK